MEGRLAEQQAGGAVLLPSMCTAIHCSPVCIKQIESCICKTRSLLLPFQKVYVANEAEMMHLA